ncbi:MAG: protein-L-isoaspartate(D-aspartate) O-methyltransferase [Desulfarculales bacterium]|jgi:protein-L-isoaspartate(D-aspartate) O-methyltransferase|nr:protein-L-isoaspartate(D-aspartate) O-methyltransferase [Desulfarculales bacterium]
MAIKDDQRISRALMVEKQLKGRDISDPRVLRVMGEIPRHCFVDESLRLQAYGDMPLFIGHGQTISQPYMVAFMTQALNLRGSEKVLEIGAGSGYQTAVLARLCDWVYAVERVSGLFYQARDVLERLRVFNLNLKLADGSLGWPENAPYEAILVAAAAPEAPAPLLAQLAEGGRLVIPVGQGRQQLLRITRRGRELQREILAACTFVPLKGEYGWPDN